MKSRESILRKESDEFKGQEIEKREGEVKGQERLRKETSEVKEI